jgi:hypothetical protein
MQAEALQQAAELAKYDNIAIRVLVVSNVVFIAANIAQWFAARVTKDEYRKDIKELAAKFDLGVANAFSYVDRISEVVEKATVKLELLLDRRNSSRD